MAIGVSGGNNPIDLSKLFNAGVAPKNPTEQVSSTETETPVDTASKAERLRAEILGDVFKTAGPNDVAKTAGASPIASSAIKFNETSGITATSVPEPSSGEAIGWPVRPFVTDGNTGVACGHRQLLLAAKMSQAAGLDKSDFQVAKANAELEKDNRLLASVG